MASFNATVIPSGSWREITPQTKHTFKLRNRKDKFDRSQSIRRFAGIRSPSERISSQRFEYNRRRKIATSKTGCACGVNGNRVFQGVQSVLKENLSNTITQTKKQRFQMQMETFGELSELCQPSVEKAQQDITDELNTPVFEKAHFNYDRLLPRSDLLDVTASLEDPFNYKIKNELSSMNTVNINDTNNIITEDSNVLPENNDMSNMSNIINADADNVNYLVVGSPGLNDKNPNTYVPCHLEYNIYSNSNNTVTPVYELVCEDEEYLPTVNNYTDIFFNNNSNSNNEEFIELETTPMTSPDLSKASVDCSNTSSKLTLELDHKYKSMDSIDTPDVIETIEAIESEKAFNILDFITDEEFTTAEPILSLGISTLIPSTSELSNTGIKQSRKRKIKVEDSDDEDYLPPPSYKRSFQSSRKLSNIISSTEKQVEEKSARRGRPSKQYSSSVSDCSSEGNGKYREMRDKNNEASRKSRLKRKLKESAQEEEAQELEDRNVKLKAQVAELEKTVNNFRTNLMQILLRK